MIILDEQLSRLSLRKQIKKRYSGKVSFLAELRPKTIIKDDNISAILIQQQHPTFITINVNHFWGKIEAHKSYCVVCFAISDIKIREIPHALKSLLSLDEFKTKASRMGKVVRVSDREIKFYTTDNKVVKSIKRD